MACNSTCPLCSLEQREAEPYTAFESQQDGVPWVSCMGCNRSAPQIPHNLRPQLFALTPDQRIHIAALVTDGKSTYEGAIKTVTTQTN